MELKLIEKDKKNNRIVFNITGTTPAFANTLRRTIIDNTPVMAIEDVEFKANSSALYDEVIAHRLGLIPLKTDLESYNVPAKCTCQGATCLKCTLKLTLKAKGPCTVYASELKSKDPKVKPVFPDMPIVKLLKNQELEFEATAVLGIGRDHMKFSPGLAWYKYTPEIEIDTKKCTNCGKCCEQDPAGILSMKGNKLNVNREKMIECTLCGACLDSCPEDAVKLKEDSSNITFYVESFGQLEPTEMVIQALNMFSQDVDEFVTKLKSV